jgi:hypothetical protein
MLQMFPDATSFGTEFARSLGSGLGRGMSKEADFARQMALEERRASLRHKADETEKFSNGMEILQKMRQIASKKNIGRGSSILGFFPGETARDRSEFAQLGKSLIPIVAAGVPIRNQREFDEYKKVITDPSSSLSDIEGAISGLEGIFQLKLGGKSSKNEEKKEKSNKIKFNLKNPEHKAKRDQLLKKYGGDREKVQAALQREFEE